MSKTIKQIADELGMSKQKVYRYIKANCISEAHQENGVMYFDETAENLIKHGLLKGDVRREVHHEAHQNRISDTVSEAVIGLLKEELAAKNKQIEELNKRLAESQQLLNQQQQLTAQAQKKIELLEAKPEPDETAVTIVAPEREPAQKRGLFSWANWRKKK